MDHTAVDDVHRRLCSEFNAHGSVHRKNILIYVHK